MIQQANHSKKWYVFRVKRFREKQLATQLPESGYQVYLPLITKPYQRNAKIGTTEKPLLSGYIFVNCNLAETEVIRYTPGILCPLCFCCKPVFVSESDIRLMTIACGCGETNVVNTCFASGDRISIQSGPFAGYDAIVLAGETSNSVYVSLGIPGTCLKINIRKKRLLSNIADNIKNKR